MDEFSTHTPEGSLPASVSLERDATDGETSFSFRRSVVIVSQPDSVAAESIRSLRSVLQAQHLQEGRRSLAVCAPSEGCGCSFLSVNLAVAFAQAGVNTLLIDGNMRQPAISDFVTPGRPDLGLADCLRDDSLPLGQAIHCVQPSLSVLFAGEADAQDLELLAGATFRTLIGSCLRDYELTIVDTPPANRFADARRISSVLHYAMVVACRRKSFVKDVRTLVKELEVDRTKVIGTYLNDY